MRGNVVDLAVAVVIGTAFGAVVTAFAKELIGSILGVLGGIPNFRPVRLRRGDRGRIISAEAHAPGDRVTPRQSAQSLVPVRGPLPGKPLVVVVVATLLPPTLVGVVPALLRKHRVIVVLRTARHRGTAASPGTGSVIARRQARRTRSTSAAGSRKRSSAATRMYAHPPRPSPSARCRSRSRQSRAA